VAPVPARVTSRLRGDETVWMPSDEFDDEVEPDDDELFGDDEDDNPPDDDEETDR
jgi:hypothetical protein